MTWAHDVRPMPGEPVAGDAAVVREVDSGVLFAIIDGLGHGPEAHAAACVAVEFVRNTGLRDLGAITLGLHHALKGTRGAAVGLCFIDRSSAELSYAGTGNTTIRTLGSQERRLVSLDGTLGYIVRTPLIQRVTLVPGDHVILHTDGVPQRFDPRRQPGLLVAEVSTVARRLAREFSKPTDDACCIAIRCSA